MTRALVLVGIGIVIFGVMTDRLVAYFRTWPRQAGLALLVLVAVLTPCLVVTLGLLDVAGWAWRWLGR